MSTAKKKPAKPAKKKPKPSAAPPEPKPLPSGLRALHALVEIVLLGDREYDQRRGREILLGGFLSPGNTRDAKWLDVATVERYVEDILCDGENTSWGSTGEPILKPLRARARELARALDADVFDLRGTKIETLAPAYVKRMEAEQNAARARELAKRKAEDAARREKYKAGDKARLARSAAAKKAAKTKAAAKIAKPTPKPSPQLGLGLTTPKPTAKRAAKNTAPMSAVSTGTVPA